uniref:Cytochrome P450 n=2 Tax=Graphocephala atropunctata TaxID=36148 RepID=A0A1B6KJS6_9HEMI
MYSCRLTRMSFFTGSTLVDILLAVAGFTYLVYWFMTNNDEYWNKRGVRNVKKGLLLQSILGKKSQNEAIQELYDTFKEERYGGFFHVKKPVLLVRDPELIHRIMVKDFTSFQDRGFHGNTNDPLTSSLFSLRGQEWRSLRYKLTPTFSAGKLKGMFEQLSKCGDSMMDHIKGLARDNEHVECKEFLGLFTLDVIASVAFGLEFKPGSPEFNDFVKTVTQIHIDQSPLKFIKLAFLTLFPKLSLLIGARPFPKEIGDYFMNLTRSTLNYRKENNIKRNDYFQLLMTLKEQEDSGKDIGLASDPSEEDVVVNQMEFSGKDTTKTKSKMFSDVAISANTFVFLSAGTESTSSIISMTLYELSQHQDIQQRLQREVDSVLKSQGGWNYQTVKDMIYLDQIVQEAQRLYPNFVNLQRVCVQDYRVPDSDLVIEKGVLVYIPHYSLQRDPQYHPDPEQFKPERFDDNNFKPSSTYMPFGDGPRICIAMRFALMEVKTCIAKIMSEYTVKLSPKTKIPLQMKRRTVVPSVEGGIWLNFERRKAA